MVPAAPDDAEIVVRLVGPFAVLRAGVAVAGADLGSRKARLLVKLLAVERGHLVPVNRIVDLLWVDEPAPQSPVENVATFRRFLTFTVLISVRALKRVDAKSFAGRTHCPSSAGRLPATVVGAAPVVTPVLPLDRDGSGLHALAPMTAADTAKNQRVCTVHDIASVCRRCMAPPPTEGGQRMIHSDEIGWASIAND